MDRPDPTRIFRLDGRIAVVTGASRGIGLALANALAEVGATTIGVARSPRPDALGSMVRYLRADLVGEADRCLDEIAKACGCIHVLVNAAGCSLPAQGIDAPLDRALAAFDATLALNLRAVYAMCHGVSRLMPPGGAIINVTSIGAHQGFPDNPGYVAAKGGVRQLTRALAVDLGPKGIRVNALAPGYIRTEMTAASHADPVRHARRAERTILGRWGTVDDLVGAAIFLASEASAYMTGQDLVIDGGWIAKGLS